MINRLSPSSGVPKGCRFSLVFANCFDQTFFAFSASFPIAKAQNGIIVQCGAGMRDRVDPLELLGRLLRALQADLENATIVPLHRSPGGAGQRRIALMCLGHEN